MSGINEYNLSEDVKNLIEYINSKFKVYQIDVVGDSVRVYILNPDYKIIDDLIFKYDNWDISLKEEFGETYVEISPKKPEKNGKLLNIVLLILTFISTTYVGMSFYPPNQRLLGGVTFSLAILFVLGSHEMGHYFVAKKWGVKTSLPYFIPAPTILGTFGAVIKQKSNCPNRKALFDIGVSGPMIGIIASVLISYIGLKMNYHTIKSSYGIEIGIPPLFRAVEILAHFNGNTISPVAFAGWVGMFVTFLNMIPAGQLDGGHVLRAMIGKFSDKVSRLMPFLILAIGYYADVYYKAGEIWIIWSFIVLLVSFVPHPPPTDDETKIDKKRYFLGILAFIIAISCFTPVPFRFYK